MTAMAVSAASAAPILVGSGPGGTAPDNGATNDALNATDTILQGGGVNSDISVSGYAGTVTDVTLTIRGMSSTWTGDWSVQLLNVDTGQFITLLNNADGSKDTAGDISFSDAGAQTVAEYLVTATGLDTGTYRPGLNGVTPKTFAGEFAGTIPNATWRLIVADRAAGDISSFAGWDLYLDGVSDSNAVPEPSTFVLLGLGVSALVAVRRRRV